MSTNNIITVLLEAALGAALLIYLTAKLWQAGGKGQVDPWVIGGKLPNRRIGV